MNEDIVGIKWLAIFPTNYDWYAAIEGKAKGTRVRFISLGSGRLIDLRTADEIRLCEYARPNSRLFFLDVWRDVAVFCHVKATTYC